MTAAPKIQDQVLHLAKDLQLPLDAITERLGFLGQSGSGKTYAAMRLAEIMLELGAQIIAVDPVGPWWGLRAGADGKSPGFPVHVFGGIHGDVPLTPTSGMLVADVLVDKQISAVIDVSDFTIGQMHTFVVDFAERFFELKKRSPTPVHVFLEEAHTFVPQQLPPDPKAALMLNRVERIVRVGRNYGIGSSLISQMPQSVNKKALNQIACLFAMRTQGPQERKAIGAWFDDKGTSKADLSISDQLPTLSVDKKGEAYVASPAWLRATRRVFISHKTTFDSSATPKFGVKLEPPKTLAAVDVEALRSAMSEVVDDAEKDDPKALRKRIAELEKQVKTAPTPKVERVEVPALKGDQLERLERLAERLGDATQDIRRTVVEALAKAPMTCAPTRINPAQPVSAVRSTPAAANAAMTPKVRDNPGLKKGAREMLRLLVAADKQLGRGLTQAELGTLAGMRRSGSFSDYLSRLRTSGFVGYDADGNPAATSAGIAAVADPGEIPVAGHVVARWAPHLKLGARKMLDHLVDLRGKPVSREDLAKAVEMELSGSFSDYLSRLRSSGLVEKGASGFAASKAVFLGEM